MSAPGETNGSHLLQLEHVSKYFGNVLALQDVSLHVNAGEVTCILGDNGAGKSTLIKILSGVHQHDGGSVRVDGEEMQFSSPRDARHAGIATVYQDLAMVPLMSIWRNFFLGEEPTKGRGPISRFDIGFAKKTAREQMAQMGIDVRDPDQPVGTLSGGERQAVAIARAIYFGARVLILDEPTSALGVKQAGVVLRYIVRAAERGVGVIFITHNPHHAYPVGGSPTNVAVAAARLGTSSAVVTAVGDDEFGGYVRAALTGFGVDTRFVGSHPTLRTPLAIAAMDPPEDPKLVFYREPSAPDEEIALDDNLLAAARSAEIFWVAGSCLSGRLTGPTTRAMLEARGRKRHTVIDLDYRPTFWPSEEAAGREIGAAVRQATVAVGNRRECEVAVGTGDPDAAADILIERGIELAIVKLGGDGVLVA